MYARLLFVVVGIFGAVLEALRNPICLITTIRSPPLETLGGLRDFRIS